MSFYYLVNGGFSSLTTIEQLHSFYSSLGTFYHSPEDLYSPPTLYKCEQPTQCDPHPHSLPHALPPDALPAKPSPPPAKPKRRVEKTVEKEILSAKKNSESNIINQFYSFFSSREKSERVVERIGTLLGKSGAEMEKILPLFYSAIRFINAKRGRKYVNVASFLRFFSAEEFGEYLGEMREKVELQCLSVEELCEVFRRCAKYFLKEVSIHAILTSKRISIVSKQEHLKKRRKILASILGN